ncbi:MAG: glycosyltransferase family 4 protein [Nitrospira sp.]|nr:glycosyltransferase family 4 protein [Nitrospira sp.]
MLTAGRDHPYAFGIATALMARGLSLDIIGGDDLDLPQWRGISHVRFLNLRGDVSEAVSLWKKVSRVLVYYMRLLRYALTSRADVFHILWNNKFETFDRVPLMLYYKFLGKRTVLTVHNVNARERDANDSWFNRVTLRIQYKLADHLFVHTNRMKTELIQQFEVSPHRISVIPFGINNAVPQTELVPHEARRRLGISDRERVLLFFGNIAPYKGLEYLIEAFRLVMDHGKEYRLIIAGRPKNCDEYWGDIRALLERHPYRDHILQRIEFIPDSETEVYFKAADAVVLPYRHIFQSGVLSLGYSMGLPVIATDVGALRDDILENETGFICMPSNTEELANAITTYFASDLYRCLNERRKNIQEFARRRYSWDVVGGITVSVYRALVKECF